MSHELLRDSRIFTLLLGIDREFADEMRAGRCAKCGGRLDVSNYPRKPRGGPPADLHAEYWKRLSLCCAEDGCRTRATPPSVRFLGRRVYLGAAVVLVSAMTHGVTDKRIAELRKHVSATICASTVRRWCWQRREEVPDSSPMKGTSCNSGQRGAASSGP